MRPREGLAFWLVWLSAVAMLALCAASTCRGDGAFTAPGGMYSMVDGRPVLNPGWQSAGGVCGPGGCGPNGCPLCPSPPHQVTPSVPSDTAHPATCRIRNELGRAACLGSGTLVDKDEHYGLVITCGHLFREGKGTVTCTFPNGQSYKAAILTTDGNWDLSALLIARPPAQPVAVASEPPKAGEVVISCGYGPDGHYRANRGFVTGYVRTETTQSTETLELTGSARQGDSGGPVFNTKGQLVAVLWGTDGRTVGGTYCGRVDKFLLCAGRYLSPYRRGVDDRLDGIQGQVHGLQNQNPQPPQVIVQPPQQGQCPQVDLGPIDRELQQHAAEIASLKDTQAKARQLVESWPELKQRVDGLGADTKDTKEKLATALDEENPRGLFGRIKARLDERLGGIFETLPWLKYGLIGLAVGLGYLFLRREGAKAAAGEPTLWQRAAALTPTEIDDRVAAKVAAGQAALHERLASLHGSVANLAGSVSALAQNQQNQKQPPAPPAAGG